MNNPKNEIEVKITLDLSKDITSDEQVASIVENVVDGLRRQALNVGITGDNFEGWATGFEVSAAYKLKPGEFCQTWDGHGDEVSTP